MARDQPLWRRGVGIAAGIGAPLLSAAYAHLTVYQNKVEAASQAAANSVVGYFPDGGLT